MLAERVEMLLADKGYDTDAIRDTLANADIEAVIPAKSNRPPACSVRSREVPLAQSHLAAVQRLKELTQRRHPTTRAQNSTSARRARLS
jgi:hypothetical protein